MAEADKNYIFIIDFDCTFVRSESLDDLAQMVLKGKKNGAVVIEEIRDITAAGMNGTIPFQESLRKRLALLKPSKSQITNLSAILKKKITRSVKNNKEFFKKNADSIYIISGGFREFIVPVVEQFGIHKSHVLANTFLFDSKGNYLGFDTKNPLTKNGGKASAVAALNFNKTVIVVGDGYTDFEIKERIPGCQFVAFTENVRRQSIADRADHIAPSIDELLFLYGYRSKVSYPKNRIKALLLENIHPAAASALEKEGYSVETAAGSLSGNDLVKKLKGISLLGIRSRTRVDADIVRQCPRLLAIGAFCIGTDQIALKESAEMGIAAFNAPYSNTRSVVELVLGEIIMLARGVMAKNIQMHSGIWNKSAKGSFEIRGKTLGIIGYGNIGSQLSVLAENIGMKVLFYDISEKLPLGNAQQVFSLRELLKRAEIITIHVDGRKSNRNLIGEREFGMMKKGVLFLNASRGFIVDTGALAAAVKSGHVAAAAVDVFPKEPASSGEPFENELQGLHNVLLTPHIGGSTYEAQENIARFVSSKLIEYLNTGNTVLSVNIPQIPVAQSRNMHRFLHIHHNVPGMLAAINAVFAKHNMNILNQILKTNGSIGYCITDVKRGYEQSVAATLAEIPHTVRSRSIYF